MKQGHSRTLGAVVLLLCATAYAIALVFFLTMRGTPAQKITGVVQLAGFFAFPVVGSLIVTRRPGNTVGWIFCAIGLGTATTAFSAGYVLHALASGADAQLATGIVDAVGNGVWALNLGLGVLLLLLFPDGRPHSRGWRVITWVAVAATTTVSLADLLMPGPLETDGRVVNPLGIVAARPVLTAMDFAGHLLLPPLALAAIAAVIVRYRHAAGLQRQQIKWFAYGAALMALLIVATQLAFPESNSVPNTIGFALAFVMLPVGAGIGVLRYRLYDIDIIINRTLVYGLLTVLLAAVYFGSVIGMQHLAAAIAGPHAGDNPLIIVLSTLLIAALFTPLRRRVQRFIDRSFYRARYDTARTLARFAATLRSEVELRALSDHLVSVVDDTMRPAHVSLWLRTPSSDQVSRDSGA